MELLMMTTSCGRCYPTNAHILARHALLELRRWSLLAKISSFDAHVSMLDATDISDVCSLILVEWGTQVSEGGTTSREWTTIGTYGVPTQST